LRTLPELFKNLKSLTRLNLSNNYLNSQEVYLRIGEIFMKRDKTFHNSITLKSKKKS
jgi:hypothetical protein